MGIFLLEPIASGNKSKDRFVLHDIEPFVLTVCRKTVSGTRLAATHEGTPQNATTTDATVTASEKSSIGFLRQSFPTFFKDDYAVIFREFPLRLLRRNIASENARSD